MIGNETLFNAADRKRIQSMVLEYKCERDTLVCNRSRDGRYSVKSSYYGAMNDFIDNTKLCISEDWNLIWSL